MKKLVFATFLGGLLTAMAAPEISWSIMHPVAIDVGYMKRVIAKAAEYGHVDSFELCGLEQIGINALSLFERYPHAAAKVDRAFVEKTRADMNAVCALAHEAGKPVYFWHRENLVPKGIFEDVPELLDADGEFDLLGKAYGDYLRYKIDDVFRNCPGLDGLVLTLTESEYSVLHNSNQDRYPAVEVVRNLVGIFTEELGRRGKRFILRSFGDGDDHTKIIDGAIAASRDAGTAFEIETKVTEADFVPWLPKNKYLKRDRPLTLGAECDALGEFLGAGYLPAAQVHRIKEYVDSAREEGASRYAIRIDRKGFSIFDSAHEANLYAYMRFIRDPQATADGVIAEYAAKRFGAAAKDLEPVLKSELELVRNMNYVCSNLTFHAFPIARDFKYVKAGGVFSLYRENEPLADMEPIWSILSEMRAPTHARILAEKDLGVRLAREGLAAVERAKDALPPDEYERQHRAFANAVTLSQALRGYTRCVVAYFEDMKEGLAEPRRLAAASTEATKTIDALMGGPLDKPYLDGLGFFCRELLREYRIERSMRLKLERPDVYDFVLPGCITDDGRVIRLMHAAYPVTKDDRIVRYAGNNRFPIGRITVKLRAPESARIEVALDPDGAQACDIRKSWSDGIWTVSVGKKGADYPGVLSIAARSGLDLQGQIDAAAAAGGGTVRVGPGEIETGPLVLKSGVTLELAKGTTLLASTNLADYAQTHAFILAENAEHVAIVGEGILCGRGWAFKERKAGPGEAQPSEWVPVLLRFSRCRDVRLEDFTFRDGAAWGCHLRNSDGVVVRRVKVFNHINNMNDGFDIESRNVLIEDCDVDADDDALVFKSESDPTFDIYNVEVRNCTLRSTCNAIKFGTGSYGLWRDIDVHDCVLERAKKSWRFDWRELPHPADGLAGHTSRPAVGVTNAVTGLAAIALEVVDGGRMENVKVRNIDIRSGYQTPIFIRMERRHPPRDNNVPTRMRNILVENVKGTAEARYACSITGLPYARPTGITLRNIDLRFPGGGTAAEAAKTPRECERDYPDNYMFDGEALPAWGFYVRHADDVRFENVKLALNAPDARPEIVREDVKDFSWDDAPDAPGFESWGFRKDLAEPELYAPAPVDTNRTAWMKTRVSRCFFSPIKRPPLNRDELADDVDYYPEPYLERLEREGVNGLWLKISWRDLAETSFTKRAPDAPRKLAKLRQTVDRCLKHGIRTYVFFIEPIYATVGDPLLKEHPELFGEPCEGMCVMCASRPEVRRYIEESVRDIFTQVPGLGGALAITHGERPTTCFSWVESRDGSRRRHCPLCDKREPWELFNFVAESVVKGMRAAGSDGEFISWFYQPDLSPQRDPWVAECARHLPDGVVLQYNFESGAEREQLGKVRYGGDYWLSYTGPSAAFRAVAEAARAAGKPIGAKIQVCNSHEMATVPYVPVPGLLYRKYRAMKELGVSEVMMCWFFGSYPGVMNRAAGELAYEDFKDGEDAFLRRLAAPYWGADVGTVANIWKRLSDAYAEYPLSNHMQYYGPFAAGAAWPLRPDIDLAPLGRTWKPFDAPSGDLIGECLENHSLAEALELASRMVRLSELPELDALAARWKGNRERMLDLGVMKALTLHFRSAYDIFDFYAARAEAVFASRCDGDTAKALAALDRMDAAASREEAVTRELLPLARADSRLGFHSEAESHQYHPAKLDWRLGKLAETHRRIAEIRKTIASGGAYPESAFEKAAPKLTLGGTAASTRSGYRLQVAAAADGGLKVTVRTPDRRPIRFSTLDALGLSVYRTLNFDASGKWYDLTIGRLAPNHVVIDCAAKDLPGGGYELTFTYAAEGWGNDPRMRPAWVQLQAGDDIRQWDFAPVWPERAPADPRLCLRHEICDFARLTWEQ